MRSILFFVLMFAGSLAVGQEGRKPIDFKWYDRWNGISSQQISDKGDLAVWAVNPQQGDGNLYLLSLNGANEPKRFARGSQPVISPGSEFIAFRIVPQSDTVRQAKIKKVKTEKMPKDTLAVWLIGKDTLFRFASLKSFRVADERSAWMAYQQEEAKEEAKAEKKDSAAPKKELKERKKPEFNGLTLRLLNPVTGDTLSIPFVTEYGFSKHGDWLFAVGIREDSVKTSTVSVFDTRTGELRNIWTAAGVVKGLVSDEQAKGLAFLHSTDTAKTKVYDLWYWHSGKKEPERVVDTLTEGLAKGMSVSENSRLSFSPDGRRVFFGTAVKPVARKDEKDTLLADDRVSVDIWNWQEDVLQSIQLKQADQERKKTYQAVYQVNKGRMVQLGDSAFIESYRLVKQGDNDVALGYYDVPYRLSNSVNYQNVKDVYLANIVDGSKTLVFKGVDFTPQLSPDGRFLYWWNPSDSSWYSQNVRTGIKVNLTNGIGVEFNQEPHDTPDEPGSYGVMGWTTGDADLYLYDQYDIWKTDPDGKRAPVCLTNGYGRKNELTIRYIQTDPEEKFLSQDKEYLFGLRHRLNKKSGFCRFSLSKPDIRMLLLEDVSFGRPALAKNGDRMLWTRSSVREYPDLWVSDADFREPRRISRANPQQDQFIWADVELVSWTDLHGENHQGLLYKPENLDPSKKYPMIVYFYERHSDGLHTHYYPRASASTVNPLEYASNGYLVFMPDIHFRVGFPGKSFYNAIMSGIMDLGKRSYVDLKHLGIQGQSWGGYGTAYMITQTDIFAAASPGAPVSNMTSAYGGIRTESGMVRQFQYEKTQSRIGGTLWEKPEYFIENSPLFFADRITTPCLIRHDDADGAVPFSEGVQLFVALRRLGKPAWLLNYNNAPHNLSRQADKKDWSVRMMQFFDHYLKGAPAPEWMTKGVRAVDKKGSETWYRSFTED